MPIPGFISDVRTKIGHDLLWLPGVTAVVLDSQGRVLLNHRVDNKTWALIGGILEPGEEPAVCIAREILEETGLRATVKALTAVNATSVITYPNGDQCQFLNLNFLCHPTDPSATHVWAADDESTEVAWFHPDVLPEGTDEATIDLIALTQKYLENPAGPHFIRS